MRPVLFTVLIILPLIASAHHSRATYYMSTVIELEGELARVAWRNPHVGFSVTVRNDEGKDEPWKIEGWGSIYTLSRTGVVKENFEAGQRVRVAGYLSTHRENDLLATHILLPDGNEVVLKPDAEPFWAGAHIGGQAGWAQEAPGGVGTATEDRGIFRVWSPSGPAGANSTSTTHYAFTESAIAGRADWDPIDNFVIRCEPNGMPRAMIAPHPWEFLDQGQEIHLRLEIGDVSRTIHMSGTTDENPAATPLGYSVGRWEGSSLEVETSAINWPYFDGSGTRQSEAVRILERFTLSDDQLRLDYHQTITDPATFTEPATYETWRLALGETVEVYDCEAN